MSYLHKNEFDRIKREHEMVVELLSSPLKKKPKAKAGTRSSISGLPSDADVIEAAVATANDAYALLLIATAEGFMRAYLASIRIPLGAEPKLSTLIDKCRKEFNKTNPKIPIRAEITQDVHDLREQRNTYAHGYGANVFPPVARMIITLGRFFDQMP